MVVQCVYVCVCVCVCGGVGGGGGGLVKVGQFSLNHLQQEPFQTLTLQNINFLAVVVII